MRVNRKNVPRLSVNLPQNMPFFASMGSKFCQNAAVKYAHPVKEMKSTMKKTIAWVLACAMLMTTTMAFAENAAPPAKPSGSEEPPAMPSGEQPPEMPGGQKPGNPPEGGGMMGGPGGGQSSQPESYDAVTTVSEDTDLSDTTLTSTDADENALLVTDGTVTVTNTTIDRTSADSTGGDTSSFYGVGAAVLTTGGTVSVSDSTITTDAKGGAGVFAYGDGVAMVSDTTISTTQDTSGGIHVAGGGTLYAKNLTVTTKGESSAAIRSDRGSGTMIVDGGTYVSSGVGSPAVYVTADITIHEAALAATGSEALCLEGLNSVRLYDCDLTGNMSDLEQNDHTWTVILYQSMSGDSAIGEGRFEMSGGSLVSGNGGIFYTTNTESEFVLSNVEISADDSEYFLRCTGNANQRGWGQTGANGADCTFTAIHQTMDGDVIWDSISTLNFYMTQGSTLTGAVVDDESYAGEGGDGMANLMIDADSEWIVTGDSVVTNLANEGTIVDEAGNAVRVVGQDGTVYVQGDSEYTVTVSNYATSCDWSSAGTMSEWDASRMPM